MINMYTNNQGATTKELLLSTAEENCNNKNQAREHLRT